MSNDKQQKKVYAVYAVKEFNNFTKELIAVCDSYAVAEKIKDNAASPNYTEIIAYPLLSRDSKQIFYVEKDESFYSDGYKAKSQLREKLYYPLDTFMRINGNMWHNVTLFCIEAANQKEAIKIARERYKYIKAHPEEFPDWEEYSKVDEVYNFITHEKIKINWSL
jgi:hypothetical protein